MEIRRSVIPRFAFCLLTVLSLTGFIANSTYAQSCPDFSNGGGGDWSAGYYRSLSVTNSTDSALTDYQIKVTLTTAALGNPYTNIKPDGSDIRFTASDKINEIPYWIESFSNTGTSTIWVKVPSLSAGDSCIYMYYGNISATSSSNGDNTFEFFDDFNDNNIDTNKWVIAQKSSLTVQETNQEIRFGGTKTSTDWSWGASITSKQTFSIAFVVTVKAKLVSTPGTNYRTYLQTGGTVHFYGDNSSDYDIFGYNDKGETRFLNQISLNTWYIFKIIFTGTAYRLYVNDTCYGQKTSTSGSAICLRDIVRADGNGHDSRFDNLVIRKYVMSEPTVSAPGAEIPVTNYILLTEPVNLVKHKSGVKIGQNIPHLKFNLQLVNHANPDQKTTHWKRLRIDKYVPTRYARMAIPDDKIEVSVWVEGNNNGLWDMKDTLISKGKFKDGKVWLDMNRYEITTMPKTFYIVYKIAQDTARGQRAGVEVKEPGYLEFEEQDVWVSQQNF